LLSLKVVKENAYIAMLPAKLHSPWATCYSYSILSFNLSVSQ